jgi:hypothetical protein
VYDASVIYVIGEQRHGVVKIGKSDDPMARLRDLQIANPRQLHLLVALPGDRAAELLYHKHFASKRVQGEWFDFGNEDAVTAVLSYQLPAEATTLSPAMTSLEEEELLLRHIPLAFGVDTRLPTAELLKRLETLPSSPWRFTSPTQGGKRLAAILGMRARVFWYGQKAVRGYDLADFPTRPQSSAPPRLPRR